MNCLVTGGAGFIGSHIAQALVEAGHEVSIVDDLSTGNRRQISADARFIEMSIADPRLDAAFADGRFEVVYHLAAQTDVMTSVTDPAQDAATNIVDGIKVLELCRRHSVRKVVYSSSSAVFGEPDYLPMDEAHAIRPLCPYAASKHTFEHYLDIYREIHGLDYTVLRYANAYGPRQNPHHEGGVVAIFTYKILRGEQPVIYGDGGQTRDFVHVADLVRANIIGLALGGGQCYNLGTGQEVDVNELFARLRRLCAAEIEPRYEDERKGEMRRLSLESAKAQDALDWVPNITLERGLETVVEFLKEHPNGEL
jgi:UDP-glucose 4-epimerase